ncbi:ABC transporter ATP-binding protein [Daeguia caeni]|uniref:ABC transporter ATP-binding protein n=1 Tax=Daeguia caeni TaxID=439612 RepID=A0ABV9H8T1_9HYPH
MAFILRPSVIVLDEPTTGLDVSTQNRILEVVRRLCNDYRTAALHVTHDLSVIATLADRLMVMYSGRVIEIGSVADVFNRPHHPYTQALLCAVPELSMRNALVAVPGSPARPNERPKGCFFAPRCAIADARCQIDQPELSLCESRHEVSCHRSGMVATPAPIRLPDPEPENREAVLSVRNFRVRYGQFEVLKGLEFDVLRGECLAIVGESGSGKSTLSRSLVGLIEGAGPGLSLHGTPLHANARKRTAEQRQRIQYIFQSPFNSLNPRHTVATILGLVYDMFYKGNAAEKEAACIKALEMVGLPARAMALFPDEMSGGERQRTSIARALLSNPEILVCDEVTSALDVSVQAAIVNLLKKLIAERNLTIIFVTHDLALVRNIADRVLVLEKGTVAELGPVAQVIDHPVHPYAQELLQNARLGDMALRVATQGC